MKIKIIFFFLLILIWVTSCSNSLDNSIKDACKQIICETNLNEWEYMTPYLRIEEKELTKDSIYYLITIELFTDLKQSLEYTKFYEVDDINILILDKDTSKHKFLSKEKKDLYTYDGNNWQLDFPSYKLRINKLNFDYNLVGHYY